MLLAPSPSMILSHPIHRLSMRQSSFRPAQLDNIKLDQPTESPLHLIFFTGKSNALELLHTVPRYSVASFVQRRCIFHVAVCDPALH
mmetsp:Transcript_103836/g.180402  ORF Transcript_103836/g.180402 Transcript_103836/m.180402 type:complete len:87 (+) Transcript_103836:1212-1472(+)